jgi:cytochrome c peroxidase
MRLVILRPAIASAFIALGLVAAGCSLRSASSTCETSAPPLDKGSETNVVSGAGVRQEGARLFGKETFGGNGRTCATCHRAEEGFSTTPASAQKRFATDQKDTLFRPADSDDGVGNQYTRLLTHASIRVRIPLKCPNIWLEDDRTATSVVLNRGIPELLNTPALDAKLMSDGRADSLEQQALGAIHDHAHPTTEPDTKDLQRMAEYESSDEFFSSNALRDFAHGGPAPELPPGNTAEEIRGRLHYVPSGLCGRCHSGPMLNTTTATSVLGAGQRFNNTRTGELVPDQIINPFLRWHVIQADGTHRVFQSFYDPGRMLITCKREDLTKFKIRSLWNVKNTAPYFHDNSAKTLEDVIAHYKQLFVLRKLSVSDQDLADILAYLKLL